jgi:hypothetical protein
MDVNKIDDKQVKITKLPPGEAVGARDLQTWSYKPPESPSSC